VLAILAALLIQQVGKPHPDFLLPKIDGSFGRLSDTRGKKVLLFHFASW
jgi:peroxiredoxin